MIPYKPKDMGEASESSAAQGTSAREFFKLVIFVACLAAGLYFAVGFAVDAVVLRLPADTEQKLFSSMDYDEPEGGAKDKKLLAELDAILEKLLASKQAHPLDYKLFLIDEPRPNAVAAPGGGIGVTRGLLKALSNDEIARAFVIGHELGHFKHRDHLRGMGRAVGLQICYALIFGQADTGGIVGTGAFELAGKNYSRSQEMKADAFGLMLVYQTYGQTKGADRLFRLLEKQRGMPGWAYMFSTHPAHEKRILALKKYAEELEKQPEQK